MTFFERFLISLKKGILSLKYEMISKIYGLKIDNPSEYFLPSSTNSTSYLIAKDDLLFLYANNYNRFVKKFRHSFQHGGISIDEIIVPVGELVGKD